MGKLDGRPEKDQIWRCVSNDTAYRIIAVVTKYKNSVSWINVERVVYSKANYPDEIYERELYDFLNKFNLV